MHTLGLIRRVAIAAAFLRLRRRVSKRSCAVGPSDPQFSGRCRAFARKRRRPDSLVGAARTTGSACPSPGGPHDGARRHAHRADRLCHPGGNQGQFGLGQHQRRRDDRGRTVAPAGERKISGFGDRPGEVRGIQSPACDPTRASARVLARQRPLKSPAVSVEKVGKAAAQRSISDAALKPVFPAFAMRPDRRSMDVPG